MVRSDYGYAYFPALRISSAYMAVSNGAFLFSVKWPRPSGHARDPSSIWLDISNDFTPLLQVPVQSRLSLQYFRTGCIPAPLEHSPQRSSS